MIYVTHDQVEAMTLADKIVVLRDGRIEQVGTPRQLYEAPANVFVAQFIGSPKMNVLDIATAQPLAAAATPPAAATRCGIRPEHLHLAGEGMPGLPGTVALAEYLGAETLLHVRLASGDICLALDRAAQAPRIGSNVVLACGPEHLHFFDAEGGALREK